MYPLHIIIIDAGSNLRESWNYFLFVGGGGGKYQIMHGNSGDRFLKNEENVAACGRKFYKIICDSILESRLAIYMAELTALERFHFLVHNNN